MEVPLDLTQLLRKLGRAAPGVGAKVVVLEVDTAGRVIHEVVPVQFNKDRDYDPKRALRGTLTFMLWGKMTARSILTGR